MYIHEKLFENQKKNICRTIKLDLRLLLLLESYRGIGVIEKLNRVFQSVLE